MLEVFRHSVRIEPEHEIQQSQRVELKSFCKYKDFICSICRGNSWSKIIGYAGTKLKSNVSIFVNPTSVFISTAIPQSFMSNCLSFIPSNANLLEQVISSPLFVLSSPHGFQ